MIIRMDFNYKDLQMGPKKYVLNYKKWLYAKHAYKTILVVMQQNLYTKARVRKVKMQPKFFSHGLGLLPQPPTPRWST